MKGVKLNMDHANFVLLVVILALVIYCVVKQNEGFFPTVDSTKVKRGIGKRGVGKNRVWAGLSSTKAKLDNTITQISPEGDFLGP
jgi:hypothetical protein